VSALTASLFAGCLNSVQSGFGTDSASLTDEQRAVAELYASGVDEFNAGAEAWNRSTEAFNESEHETALTRSNEAIERFETAQGSFSEAGEKALTIGADDAAGICEDAAERAGLMLEAARAGRKGAQAAADGEDASTINEHIQTSQQRREEASQFEIPDTETFQSTLGG